MKHRRTKAELEAIDEQIIAVLRDDHPQSVRHVFYRLTDPRLPVPVPKTEHGYKLVQRQCLKLRRAGLLDYGWISDTTRRGYHVHTFDGPGDFIERAASLYRAQLWDVDAPHVEVWCESRSLAGVLETTCRELAVSLYPAGGFASATLAYEAAREIDARRRDRAVVLYVGDYDPAGVLIDRSMEKELRRHLVTPLTVRRLAVNRQQIEAFDLPTKPRREGERRRPEILATVEAEAMEAGVMRRLVREAVESYLPDGALDAVQVAEESEREGLRRLGQHIEAAGMPILL